MTTATKQNAKRTYGVLLGIMLALFLAICMSLPASAFADPTTYTIRLYGGNRGTVNGQEMFEWNNLAYGSSVDFGQATIAVIDDKYYAKGARPAGLDNVKDVEYVALVDASGKLVGSTTVTEDADYVIAYGVLADRVEYTVRCVDRAGNELAAPQTYMGDVGDMPAMAAPYFENYVPNAYEATIVLSDDPARNLITFTYARVASGYTTEQNSDGTISVVTPSGNRMPLAPGPSVTVPSSAASSGDVIEDAEDVVDPDGTEILTDDGAPLTTPIQNMTITDDEAPLASADDIDNTTNPVVNLWVSVLLFVGAIALLVIAFVLWRRNRSQSEERK